MPDPTYNPGGADPISRLREIPGVGLTIADARLQAYLDASLSQEHLLVYLPTGQGGATGATVEVALSDDNVPTLILTREGIVDEDPTEIGLGFGRKIKDIIDDLAALDRGWVVGVCIGRDIDWCTPSSSGGWESSLVVTNYLPRFAPAVNLALHDEADAYGDETDAVTLRFYQLGLAARSASATGDAGSVVSRSEGNVSRRFALPSELSAGTIGRMVSQGLYAV